MCHQVGDSKSIDREGVLAILKMLHINSAGKNVVLCELGLLDDSAGKNVVLRELGLLNSASQNVVLRELGLLDEKKKSI